jgi:hypothetical protein
MDYIGFAVKTAEVTADSQPISREELLLHIIALDDTGGCLRLRSIVANQPDIAVRREYSMAVKALTAGGLVSRRRTRRG